RARPRRGGGVRGGRSGADPGGDTLEGARVDRGVRRGLAAADRPPGQLGPDADVLDRPPTGRGGGGARGPDDRAGGAVAKRVAPFEGRRVAGLVARVWVR